MDEKRNETKTPENPSPIDVANEAAATSKANKNAKAEALLKEVYALRESVNRLKEQNEMLSELVSYNFENTDSKGYQAALTKKLIRENAAYKKLAAARIKDIIYNKVKAEYPDIAYSSFDEFPEDFHRLVCARVSPVTAYKATLKIQDKTPKAMGKVNENSENEKDFYTSTEVDKLTKKQLSNPRIMEKVMKSMLKW